MYATGTAARSAEAQSELQLEAPTSPDPQFPYDPEPPLSPYESPTDAAFEAGMPQSPVGEPHDEAPTSLSFESPAAPATDAAATDQDASPTEAPPD
jgi:hypothetical protein